MPAKHCGEMAEFVVNFFRVGDGLCDRVSDRLAPELSQAVEMGSYGCIRNTFGDGYFLERGISWVRKNPRAKDGQPLACGRGGVLQCAKRNMDDILGPVAVVHFDVHAGVGRTV